MDKCKVHGLEYDRRDDNDDCPKCSANFWEDEYKRVHSVLQEIADSVCSEQTDTEVLELAYDVLKKEGLI
jgi:hypothetical protein